MKEDNILHSIDGDYDQELLCVEESVELHNHKEENKHDKILKDIFNDEEKARKFIERFLNIVMLREEGKEEGRKEARIEVAKNMIKEGYDIDLIYTLTGLKKTKIKELLNNCK